MLSPEPVHESVSSGVFVSAISEGAQGSGDLSSPLRATHSSANAQSPPSGTTDTHALHRTSITTELGSRQPKGPTAPSSTSAPGEPRLSNRSEAGEVSNGAPEVRHTSYLGNFIRDPAERRAAVEAAAGGRGESAAPTNSEASEVNRSAVDSGTTRKPALPLRHSSAGPPPSAELSSPTAKGTPASAPSPSSSTFNGAGSGVPVTVMHPVAASSLPPIPPSQSHPSGQVQTPAASRAHVPHSHGSTNGASTTAAERPLSAGSPAGPHQFNAGGSTVVIDTNGYVNVDDIPVRLSTMGRRDRPWHYGMCQCCHSCDACLEAWYCLPCQVSRQCNMLLNDEASIHWPFCLLIVFSDCCTGCSLVSCLFVGQSRRMARERYGIAGSGVSDCCAGYWCRCCALEQVLLEMTVMNDFPGATCYQIQVPVSPQWGTEMR